MIPTFIGVLLLIIGLPIMFKGGASAMLALLIACGPLGGSAAATIPALGTSITPVHFVLGLLILRVALDRDRGSAIGQAIAANWPLLSYAVLSAVLAYVSPRLFQNMIYLPPLKYVATTDLYAVAAVTPTSQNLTTAVYTFGSALAAVVAYVAMDKENSWRTLVTAIVWTGWANVALGILSVIGHGTPIDTILKIFRNGNYAQLSHEYAGFVRMTGIFPEASAFAGYTLVWFFFTFECWFRDVLPRRTGPLSLATFLILVVSTSGTAYVGLGVFSVVTALRLLPWGSSDLHHKVTGVLLAAFFGVVFVCGALAVVPGVAAHLGSMIEHMTVDKSGSSSGLQRSFQMRMGLQAFTASYGIGVGPGSFRSSGIVFAILGSTGVIGFALYMINFMKVWKPFRRSTFLPIGDISTSTGIAAAWAIVLNFFPASTTSPSSDFGITTGLLTGVALALRKYPKSHAILSQIRRRPILSEHLQV